MSDVCVIGGSGFIGSRLIRRLSQINFLEVLNIDKDGSEVFPQQTIIADVRSFEQLRSTIQECDVIINLAAEHRDDVRPLSLYDEVNAGGAKNICNVAREKGVQSIVFTSSVAV